MLTPLPVPQPLVANLLLLRLILSLDSDEFITVLLPEILGRREVAKL